MRGEIVLLPFPSLDQSRSESIPAVILSTDTYNISRNQIIVAPIIGLTDSSNSSDVILHDWSQVGLHEPSVVCAQLATISQSLVVSAMGVISGDDLAHVESMISNSLDLADEISRSNEQA